MLDRRKFVQAMLRSRGQSIVISSLGNPTYDVASAGDTPANFYLWGAMGGAAAMGLGLAIGQPQRRIVVVVGDGEMIMGLTTLAAITATRPENLGLLVLDNQSFAETGAQTGLTAKGVDLCALARASGFTRVLESRQMSDVPDAAQVLFQSPGPVFVHAAISLGETERVLPERDGVVLSRRTRELFNRNFIHGPQQ